MRDQRRADPVAIRSKEPVLQPTVHHPADWMFLQPAILDLMHEAVITTDLQGMITGCNKAAQRIFGFTAKTFIGKNVAEFYAEEERHFFYDTLLPAVHHHGEYIGEVRNRTESGDYIYIHLSVALLKDGAGEPVGMVGFSVDVTSQKLGRIAVKRNDQLEQELSLQQEDSGFLQTLKQAVERSTDVILITEAEPVDQPGPRIVYVNPAFERLTGYASEEVVGKTPRILQGAKTSRTTLDRIRKALRAWRPVREEMVNYRKDGSEFTIELSIVPIADEKGWYTHWFAIQRETTEQSLLRDRLEASEVRLRTITESVPQFLWTADSEGRRDWVSDTFSRFLGVSTEHCLGDGWIRYVHPEDRDKALKQLQAKRRHNQTCSIELRLLGKDGSYSWFLKQAAPLLDKSGEVSKWVGSFTDISDRVANETALRTSEERAHLGIAVARLALAEIDYRTGINHLSAEASVMYGLGDKSISVPRESVHNTFHPEDQLELSERIAACLDPAGSGWFSMDHRVVWPSGEARWLRVRKQVFFEGDGPNRTPVRALLAAFDVSESKRAEAQVRESAKRFRDLAESLPQFIWVTDGAGEKTYCNQRYLDYLGTLTYESLHNDWQQFLHPEDRKAAVAAWQHSLETGTPYLQEYRLRRHDGEYRHVLARGIPVRSEYGTVERWLGSSTDVHDRKLAEETLRRTEKLAVVGRMASSISHGINNPLAGVVNLLYLMDTSPNVPSELRELLHSAQEQLARVSEVATQTLMFHRQSSKAASLRVSDTVDSLIALHKPALEQKHIRVVRRDRRTPELHCFVGEIRQALAHILNNSLDALPPKGRLIVGVRDSTLWREQGKKGIRITVADSGHGIATEDLPFIFDAFFSTRGLNGTGLGLWISKEIIERHGGFIRVKSSVQAKTSGTVVHICFPCG